MVKNRHSVLLVMLVVCLFLGGCQSSIQVISGEDTGTLATLPPPEMIYDAPVGDAGLDYETTATLFLPRADGVRLIAQQVRVKLPVGKHGAEVVLEELFKHPGNANVQPLTKNVSLQLTGANPVEISRDVATVNLSSAANLLEPREFYTVCQAIANTLTEFSDIRYVNVLVAGTQVGLDISATLPMGTLQRRTSDDINVLWEQADAQRVPLSENPATRRLSTMATLYFPARMGTGILPEVRNMSFEGQTIPQLVTGILQELYLGAEYLGNVPTMPDLVNLLTDDPVVSDISSGGRKVTLRFSSDLNDALNDNGLTRSICMASLTYTLTTFLPNIAGVEVYIDDMLINEISPSSIYIPQQTIAFSRGLQQRSDYGSFLLSYCKLYFGTEGGKLTAVNRPVPYYQAKNPRYLLLQLSMGPMAYDSVTGLSAVFPSALRDADVIGVGYTDDTMLVHLSDAFKTSASALSATAERQLIYAVVNTLCENPVVSRVRFYIAGSQPETLAGEIYLPGEFFQNPGIVQ